jgi:hypothetical protein
VAIVRDEYRSDWPMALDSTVISINGTLPKPGADDNSVSVTIGFANNASFRLSYWRLFTGNQVQVTSFDHGSKLGDPVIDSIAELTEALAGRHADRAELDLASGGVTICFDGGIRLQALRLRSLLEDWEVRGPDSGMYWSTIIWLAPGGF